MTIHPRPRVLFVIGSMGGGGAERQILEILKRLDRTRFRPFLYLAHKSGELLADVPADVPVFAYWDESGESWFGRFVRAMKLTRLARYLHLAQVLHDQSIDVVYDRTYLATLDAAGGCFFRHTPRISCCVVDPKPELEQYARFSKSLSWWFARQAYNSARVVLTNSAGLKQRFVAYFRLHPNHVLVFYNLLASVRIGAKAGAEHDTELDEFLNRPGIELDDGNSSRTTCQPFLIVTAGRLHPQKGHQILLEAVDELVHKRRRALKLIIFGKGELEHSLKEYVRSHRLESAVLIAGFVEEPRHWYAKADLFVLPSQFEGMPNALIEAAADGLPVLATDCPSGPAEILDHGRCGCLVPMNDPGALANAIEDSLDHPQEWRSRAELAQRRVEQLFDPVAGMARLEKLIEDIATGR